MANWADIIVSVLSGLAVCIPLVVQLVKYVKAAIQERKWTKVMELVLNLMTEAERNYATGAERKEYVMASIESIKDVLDYEVDMNAISEIIDAIVAASKIINTKELATKS